MCSEEVLVVWEVIEHVQESTLEAIRESFQAPNGMATWIGKLADENAVPAVHRPMFSKREGGYFCRKVGGLGGSGCFGPIVSCQ
jgi:hypothetical protein